jgi:hypothetical protein
MTNFDINKENVSLIQHSNFVEKSVNAGSHQEPQLDWVDTMVNCANIMNKIFTRNTCRLCHIYSDKQVEFEERIQQNATITATAAEWYNIQQQNAMSSSGNDAHDYYHDSTIGPLQTQSPQFFNNPTLPPNSISSSLSPVDPEAVELYRKYLFDEESVVDSIEMRIGRSTDEDEVIVNNDDDDNNVDEMKDVQLT